MWPRAAEEICDCTVNTRRHRPGFKSGHCRRHDSHGGGCRWDGRMPACAPSPQTNSQPALSAVPIRAIGALRPGRASGRIAPPSSSTNGRLHSLRKKEAGRRPGAAVLDLFVVPVDEIDRPFRLESLLQQEFGRIDLRLRVAWARGKAPRRKDGLHDGGLMCRAERLKKERPLGQGPRKHNRRQSKQCGCTGEEGPSHAPRRSGMRQRQALHPASRAPAASIRGSLRPTIQ